MTASGPTERYRAAILTRLGAVLEGETHLREILRYHVGMTDVEGAPASAHGKLLRPSLVLMIAEGLGADVKDALDAAVALELVHNFSLIHDDIQDRDEVRRGRPTVWALHGVAEAINAGDLMLTIAMGLGIEAGAPIGAALARAVDRMIEGQSLDLQFESRMTTTDEYIGMVDRKTGALLSCAFELGGLTVGAPSDVIERLTALGRSIGRAFQIQDDLLGIWGDGDVVGKPQGSDIRRRKKSFPIAAAFAQSVGEEKARLEAAYASDAAHGLDDEDVAWVIGLLDRLDVRSMGKEAVLKHHGEALAAIEDLPIDSGTAKEMRALIERLAGRVK